MMRRCLVISQSSRPGRSAYDQRVTVAELGKGLIVRLLRSLTASVPGAIGAGLVLHEHQADPRHVAGVGAAEQWDAAQLGCRCGPLFEAAASDEVRMVDPFVVSEFDGLVAPEDAAATRAVVVVPGAWTAGARLSTTLYLDTSVTTQAVTTLGAYEPLLAQALGLLEYCGDAETRADQMLAMMQYRRVIEQAKGMVMTRRAVGADEAFALLAQVSQRRNVRLRELAVALVEGVGGAPAEQPADGRLVLPTAEAVEAAKRLWDDLEG